MDGYFTTMKGQPKYAEPLWQLLSPFQYCSLAKSYKSAMIFQQFVKMATYLFALVRASQRCFIEVVKVCCPGAENKYTSLLAMAVRIGAAISDDFKHVWGSGALIDT